MTNHDPTPPPEVSPEQAEQERQLARDMGAQPHYGAMHSVLSANGENKVTEADEYAMATVAYQLTDAELLGGSDEEIAARQRNVLLDLVAVAHDREDVGPIVDVLMTSHKMAPPSPEEEGIIAQKRAENAQVAREMEGIYGELRGLLPPGMAIDGSAAQFLERVAAECRGLRHATRPEDQAATAASLLATYQGVIAAAGLPPKLYSVAQSLLLRQGG